MSDGFLTVPDRWQVAGGLGGFLTSYTGAALLGVVVTLLLEALVLRTGLLRRRLFWASYAVVLGFQFLVNGVLTGRDVVRYDPDAVTGLRVAFAPVEDLLFGWAMIAQTLLWWVWLGRLSRRPRRSPGPDAPRPAAASRR